jgi:hypothetical protein
MVKYIKIGRFAVAYDNTQPNDRSKSAAKVPPPPPSPPPKSDVRGSGWSTFGKFMLGLFGLLVVLLFIGSVAGPAEHTESNVVSPEATEADPTTATGACERADVQELVGKEARGVIMDSARSRLITLAIFGLIDPQETRAALENAQITFTDVTSGGVRGDNVPCTASLRIDASNANAGQDIVQLPAVIWQIALADGDGNVSSSNFTVKVDPASVFEGMRINGKPAGDFLNQDGAQAPEEPTPAPGQTTPQLKPGQPYSDARAKLIGAGYAPARYSVQDCSPYGTARGEECFDRPEVESCSGTGKGYCSAYWLRGDDILSVLISDGPDGIFEQASPMSRADLNAVLAQNERSLAD